MILIRQMETVPIYWEPVVSTGGLLCTPPPPALLCGIIAYLASQYQAGTCQLCTQTSSRITRVRIRWTSGPLFSCKAGELGFIIRRKSAIEPNSSSSGYLSRLLLTNHKPPHDPASPTLSWWLSTSLTYTKALSVFTASAGKQAKGTRSCLPW